MIVSDQNSSLKRGKARPASSSGKIILLSGRFRDNKEQICVTTNTVSKVDYALFQVLYMFVVILKIQSSIFPVHNDVHFIFKDSDSHSVYVE